MDHFLPGSLAYTNNLPTIVDTLGNAALSAKRSEVGQRVTLQEEGPVRCPRVNLSLADDLPAVNNIIGDRESARNQDSHCAMSPNKRVTLADSHDLPVLVYVLDRGKS